MSEGLYDPAAVSERLRALARLTDLRAPAATAGKVDMSPKAVGARLRLQATLRAASLRWSRLDPRQR